MLARFSVALACSLALTQAALPNQHASDVERFPFASSGLRLSRPVTPGAFFDVVGRRSAAFGYEGRPFEVWVYPMKLLDDFRLSFALEGYPLEIDGLDVIASIDVRPEATTLTYSHAAFTVRQIMIAPIDEPGLVILLDVATTRPMRITASFRPRLRLMWPAGLMTAYVSWQADAHAYAITEETGRFAGVVGAPGARDVSLMPYQEEPRDVPVRFVREIAAAEARTAFVPIVMAGSVRGVREARATYDRLLASARDLYEKNVAYYEDLLNRTTDVSVPDERLTTAFRWAKVGVDKGLATNPFLGTGLLAGFRASGESERPGFAWFFGRDALWSALAITSYGDFAAVRTALEFLATHQRADGKIPHEVSQSATLIPWFTDYPYPWASADATPLYVIAHNDHWRASGDTAFLQRHWESIVKAYRFSAATDTDGNELIENTGVGHGWVEGGALYPPHEELYLQGAWIEALNGLAELAGVMNDSKLAAEARGRSERTRAAVERRYWLEDRGFYAFATAPAKDGTLVAEDTVLPAVPLWWGLLRDDRAQLELDHLGSGAIATDWGARILSNRSASYDPLSYHYGSVWPLFTGWTAMAAYRYGRPHVGYQALAANALLTFDDALGYVTELLSGDFNAAFGRSSHHQIWSEAMVITPIVRGLFGVEATDGGRTLRIRPQLPADWDAATLRRVAVGRDSVDVSVRRGGGRMSVVLERTGAAPARVVVAPAFPLDARVRGVKVNGRPATFDLSRAGDVQRAEVTIANVAAPPAGVGRGSILVIDFDYRDGSDVYVDIVPPAPGADNQGLRVLRSLASPEGLRLTVEGRGGRTYEVRLRTPRQLSGPLPSGVRVERAGAADPRLLIGFEGAPDDYVRREVLVPLGGVR